MRLLTMDQCNALRAKWEKDIGAAAKDVLRVLDAYEFLLVTAVAAKDAGDTLRELIVAVDGGPP
jgi:hypothetical protein